MNRGRNGRRPTRAAKHEQNVAGIDAKAITSMVAAGRPNPFLSGSREHIAYGWTKELSRHAESDKPTTLAAQAWRIFPNAGAGKRRAVSQATGTAANEPATQTPPVPVQHPQRPSLDTVPPLPGTKPEIPKVPYMRIWRPEELFPVSREFADKIDKFEKSFDRWDLVNSETDAAGRYQLLPTSLFDIGLMNADKEWHDDPLPSGEEFLQSQSLQNLAFAAYLTKMWGYAEGIGIARYVGQEIEGSEGTFEITEAGLLAAAHREGQGRTNQYLAHLAANEWVSDPGTFPLDRIPGDRTKKDAFEQIEERLIGFEGIALRASDDAPALNESGSIE